MMRPRTIVSAFARRSRATLAFRTVATAVILIALAGCDNVTWGGFQLSLQGSASNDRSPPEAEDGEVVDEPPLPETPGGPVLFLVQREVGAEGGAGSLIPLARISGDSLLPIVDDEGRPGFPSDFDTEQLSEGSTFTLFAEGTRVGSFRAGADVSVDSTYCFERPRARGRVEIVPEAAGASAFLALRRDAGDAFEYGPFQALESDYDQRVASLSIAGDLIPRLSASWPPSVLEAREDLRIFALDGDPRGAIAVTFMHRDALAVGAAPQDSYALFFVARNGESGYVPEYVWYRPSEAGKAAPRFLGHFDWDRDGSDGIVLEVQGAEKRWFAAAGPRRGAWQTLFEDPCGRAASAGQAGPLD